MRIVFFNSFVFHIVVANNALPSANAKSPFTSFSQMQIARHNAKKRGNAIPLTIFLLVSFDFGSSRTNKQTKKELIITAE